MQTLEAIRRRIDNARDMQSVVAAMKVLAVVSIRQLERSLESLDEYNRTLELGLQATLAQRPRGLSFRQAGPGDRICALIFGSEQGLSGQFNEQIVAWSLEQLARLGSDPAATHIVAMGEHVVYRLQAAGCRPARVFPIPGAPAAARAVSRDILAYIDELPGRGLTGRVMIFCHKPLSGASYAPHSRLLFPPDRAYLEELARRAWPSRSIPAFSLEWRELFAALARQHLRASLERAFVQSLLSENASRLFSMQVAEKNITDHLEDLSRRYNNRRQGEITAELLDIVAGSEALRDDEEPLPARTR